MKIYYNHFYTSRPFLNKDDLAESFGVAYCGDEGLLNFLMLHGGIPSPQVSPEDRAALYHNNMKRAIKPDSPYYKSFALDPLSVSNAILKWRDNLVAAGWNLKTGFSTKLDFLRMMEPKDLPCSIADCWNKVLKNSKTKQLLPVDSEIVVTQTRKTLDPKIQEILQNQESLGLKVTYSTPLSAIAEGDLGRIQKWMIDEESYPIDLKFDGSIRFLYFDNDDEAIRFIAAQQSDKWELYLCQQPKQFDNELKYLGKPTCGSNIDECEPQVAQLFMIGNGLFEYPLNLPRIIAWLNSSINPLDGRLRRSLLKVLVDSGGVGNEEWDMTITNFVLGLNPKLQNRERRTISKFLPLPSSDKIKVNEVIDFNSSLKQWCQGLLSMDVFPFEDMIREQLRQIVDYCQARLTLRQPATEDETMSFLSLQNLCRSILTKKSYTQYLAEEGCCNLISSESNIHSYADSLIWFCINNDQTVNYPFDFLTDREFEQLKEGGVKLYQRSFLSLLSRYALAQTVCRTKNLTLVECGKIKGEDLKRHPLMILLNEISGNELSKHFESPKLSIDKFELKNNVDNTSDKKLVTLDSNVKLTLRSDSGSSESYTSLDLLLQHPFDYVCRYRAHLNDVSVPSVSDLERTMGNVAHLIIQLVFEEKDKGKRGLMLGENYDLWFEKAIKECGMLLSQPEFSIYHKELKQRMREVLFTLEDLIQKNGLTVLKCEAELDKYTLPLNGHLESRADMLLKDNSDNHVVFDFKWTPNFKKYQELVKNNRSLQLAIYSAMEEYGSRKNVRSAYVLLPSVDLISADKFVGFEPVECSNVDIMTQAKNGYVFRANQFAEGQIERAEGLKVEDSEYGAFEKAYNLYPLDEYNGEVNRSYNDYQKLK